jgi:hypothetical protein
MIHFHFVVCIKHDQGELREGMFIPNKISGVGTIFGQLVHVLPGPNKQRAFEPSILLS